MPELGRLLTADDDRTPGNHPVAVMSYDFWTRRFARDPQAVGRWIHGEKDYQIVGVARRGFRGVEPGVDVEMWLPSMMGNPRAFDSYGWSYFRILGRLQPGHTREELRNRLQVVYSDTNRERMKRYGAALAPKVVQENLRRQLLVNSGANGASRWRRRFTRPLWILGGAALGVLLIACAVLANLLLARAASRGRELAMRVSIGAGRFRLMQQLLVEATLLSLAAALLACLISVQSASWITKMMGTAQEPVFLSVSLDWRVAAAMAALSLIATLLFGFLPAWRAARIDPHEALKAGGARLSSRSPVSRALVGAQVAFCCLLVFVAGLFLRSFQRLAGVDIGFEARNLTLLELELTGAEGPAAKTLPIWLQLQKEAAAAPGVERSALSAFGLFTMNMMSTNIRLPGTSAILESVPMLPVSPGFLSAMGIGLLAGRDLREQDLASPAGVALVNQAFVRRFLSGRPPLGRRVEYAADQGHFLSFEVVGVVGDARYGSVRDPAPPTAYLPFTGGSWRTLVLRSRQDRHALARLMDASARRLHPGLRVTEIHSQEQLVNDALARERLLAVLSSFFSTVSLLLAAAGLYGVLSYLVAQRSREFGIRLALGSSRAALIALVLGESVWVTLAGVAAGLGAGVYLARYALVLLYQVTPTEAWSLAVPALALFAASLLAAVGPVWRATHVDAVLTLRDE